MDEREKALLKQRIALKLRERYRRDFALFAREQIKIRGAKPGEILTLDVNRKPAQQVFERAFQRQMQERGYVRLRGLKARQQGFSTIAEGHGLHASGLNRNTNSLLIANDKETTETIFRIGRFAYDNMSPAIRPLARYDSKSELVFENPDPKTRPIHPGLSSRMTFVQAKELAGTGTTIHFLHTSETSKWPLKATEMLETSLLPALHYLPGTVHIDESTAYTRLGDYFREKCNATRQGKDGYGWVMTPWWLDPSYALPLAPNERFTRTEEERAIVALAKAGQPDDGVPRWELTKEQLNWRRTIIASRGVDGDRLFLQEYLQDFDSAWVTFDVNVFPLDALNRQARNCCMPEYFAELKPSNIHTYTSDCVKLHGLEWGMVDADEDYVAIWKLPVPGRRYAMGVDVALGIQGGDWTVLEILDQQSREQVAEAHFHFDPDDAGHLAFSLGMYFNIATINTELTGPGYNTDARLKKNFYPNLYFWRNRDRRFPLMTKLTGWKTSPESKKFLIGATRPLFSHDIITIHSRVLLNELRHFVAVPGFIQDSYYAETGDDDCVMSLMFAVAICHDDNYFEDTALAMAPKELPADELRARHELAVREEAGMGPWARDTRDFNSDPSMAVFDGLVNSLKGWD